MNYMNDIKRNVENEVPTNKNGKKAGTVIS